MKRRGRDASGSTPPGAIAGLRRTKPKLFILLPAPDSIHHGRLLAASRAKLSCREITTIAENYLHKKYRRNNGYIQFSVQKNRSIPTPSSYENHSAMSDIHHAWRFTQDHNLQEYNNNKLHNQRHTTPLVPRRLALNHTTSHFRHYSSSPKWKHSAKHKVNYGYEHALKMIVLHKALS